MVCAEASTPSGASVMDVVSIDASGLATKELNDRLREQMILGKTKIIIHNVCGQRYIGTRLYFPGNASKMDIEIYGTPGNDMGAFLFGHRIRVHGNVQDGVGNTMDDGLIVVEGRGGDVLGLSMRGGKIFIRDSVGYRTALHMKEYVNKVPVMVIGGTAQDFLGEYMAGGIVILLGIGVERHDADFIGSGMHGGAIFIRGSIEPSQVGNGVEIRPLDQADREILAQHVGQFMDCFPELEVDREAILKDRFVKLVPVSKRPYGNMYAY